MESSPVVKDPWPGLATAARVRSSRLTRSSWRTCLQQKVSKVEGVLTKHLRTLLVPLPRAASA